MYEKVEKCPLCSNKKFKNELICKDYSVTKESFAIVSCLNCNLWITSPRPTEDKLYKYYESPEYISHTNASNNFINFIYKIVRTFTIRSKIQLMKRLHKHGRILDYGCGTGDFIYNCKKNGFEIMALEPNYKARLEASKKTGIEIYEHIKQHDKEKKVDIITLWHVLEHIADFNKIMAKLKKRLNENGYIVIAVPNRLSVDAQHYKEHWAGYDIPRHLYHFNKSNIQLLAKNHKLKLVEVLPQYFDSFYVSMLSEKHKGEKNSFIRGLKTGFQSNMAASKNKGEYSSRIYILKN